MAASTAAATRTRTRATAVAPASCAAPAAPVTNAIAPILRATSLAATIVPTILAATLGRSYATAHRLAAGSSAAATHPGLALAAGSSAAATHPGLALAATLAAASSPTSALSPPLLAAATFAISVALARPTATSATAAAITVATASFSTAAAITSATAIVAAATAVAVAPSLPSKPRQPARIILWEPDRATPPRRRRADGSYPHRLPLRHLPCEEHPRAGLPGDRTLLLALLRAAKASHGPARRRRGEDLQPTWL